MLLWYYTGQEGKCMNCATYTGQLADGFESWLGRIDFGGSGEEGGVGGVGEREGGGKGRRWRIIKASLSILLPGPTSVPHFVYNAGRGLSSPCHLDSSHGDPTPNLENKYHHNPYHEYSKWWRKNTSSGCRFKMHFIFLWFGWIINVCGSSVENMWVFLCLYTYNVHFIS